MMAKPENEEEAFQMDAREAANTESTAVIGEDDEVVTDKRAVWIAAGVYLFGCIAIQAMASVTTFEYLKEIISNDRPEVLFGICLGISKLAQALVLIVSTVITNHFHRYRYQFIIGRAMSIVGLLGYVAAGIFPTESRGTILQIAFFLVGASEGTLVLIRGYAPRLSSISDRAACMAIVTTAGMGGLLFGPLTNLIFSLFGKDTLFRFLGIDWNLYTLPCLLLLAYNIVSLVLTFQMKDPSVRQPAKTRDDSNFVKRTIDGLKQIFVGVDIPLFLVLIAAKVVSCGCFFAVIMTFPAHLGAVANQEADTNAIIFSAGQICGGLLAAGVAVVYSVFQLGTKRFFQPVHTLMYSLVIFAGFGLISLPWPFASPLVLASEIVKTGCNSTRFAWCDTTFLISMYAWFPLGSICLGIGLPLALISQDTLYSRILEQSKRADLLQGLYGLVECITLGYVPYKANALYTSMGPFRLYRAVSVILVVSALAFAVFIPRFSRVLQEQDARKTPTVRDVQLKFVPNRESEEQFITKN